MHRPYRPRLNTTQRLAVLACLGVAFVGASGMMWLALHPDHTRNLDISDMALSILFAIVGGLYLLLLPKLRDHLPHGTVPLYRRKTHARTRRAHHPV